MRLACGFRRALESADAVLGPSEDGGFYLLGLRRIPEGLLDGLPWSVAETFERTMGSTRPGVLGFVNRFRAPGRLLDLSYRVRYEPYDKRINAR